jgi:hypothetical protein
MTTYSKLKSGDWGVRGPVAEVRDGAVVKVAKRDGAVKTETIDRVIWTDGTVALAAIVRAVAAPAPVRASGTGRRRGGCHTDGNCSSCCSPKLGGGCPCADGGWFRCC